MQQYILHRTLLFIPTVFGISLLIFALLRVMPGDVAAAILGDERRPEVIEQVRHDLGLDKPLPLQYLEWMGGVIRGDFGKSYWYKTSVLEEIAKRYPVTLELAVLSIFFAILIAIPTGVISAIKQDTMVDYTLRIFTIGGLAIPNFWLGTLMILALVIWFRWIPPFGYVSPTQDLWANLQQFLLPSLALGYSLSAILSRMTRSQMLEVLREDYIRTARAKGLLERNVVLRHALKNMLLPVVTLSGIQLGFLLGGTVIMESIFVLPGMGRNLVDSILHRDYPMTQGIVLLMALTYTTINLLVDVLYAWLDPRINYR